MCQKMALFFANKCSSCYNYYGDSNGKKEKI